MLFGFLIRSEFMLVQLFSKIISIMHMHMQIMQHVGPICSSPKEVFAHYIRHTYSRW
jgi:hypothetical protein